MGGGGEHPPTNPKYDADGSGRDTYIRRDPIDCYGKQLYKTVERIPTRFGTAGANITEYTGSGYAGYVNGHDNVGGKGGFKVVPARYLVPHPPAFPVEVKHFSTMKDIIQDQMAGLAPGGTQEFPSWRGHVAGYSGFQPRCPTMGVGPQDFVSLSELDKEAAAEGA